MANDISTSFNDRQMFLTQPNWGEDITSRVAIERRILDQLGGVKTISQINTDAPITVDSDFTLSDREAIYDMLDFFKNRKGGTESFWFLHPSRFFTLKQKYVSGSNHLVVERNYSDLWTQALPSQYDWGIYIYMKSGDLICRKVTGITDETDHSKVYLDETISRNIALDKYRIIGRTLVGRFNQDQLKINFTTQGFGRTPLKLEENYREFDTWTPIEGTKQWDVEDQTQGAYGKTVRSYGSYNATFGNIINSWTEYPFMCAFTYYYWYHIAVYFYDVQIPQGVTIKNCTLSFVSSGDSSPYVGIDYNLRWADYDDAPSFSTVAAFMALNKTTAVRWNITNGTEWTEDERIETPNFAESLDEVVNRSGWDKGNALLFCGMCRNTYYGYHTKGWKSGHDDDGRIRLSVEWV